MFFIKLDDDSNYEYLYREIYEKIKNKILKNKINEGDKLPSKRNLADQLGVSVNTITSAYEQLLVEGYIYTIERSGYFVEEIVELSQPKTSRNQLLPNDLKETVIKDNPNQLSLSHMDTDVDMFPFKEWFKSQQTALKKHQQHLGHITHQQGPLAVRQTLSKMINVTRGVDCEPEQIVISVGTQTLVEQALNVLQLASEEPLTIAVENPGYQRLYGLMEQLNAKINPISVDENGISVDEVKQSSANTVFLTPSHQFPTGAIMPISKRFDLLNWTTKKPNHYIIEDDYDSEFKYQTDNIPSLQSLDFNQKVIYMGSFSKSLLMGFRISYMVLPYPLLRIYRKHYNKLLPYNNVLSLFTLNEFILEGKYLQHIKRMNLVYEKKRNELINQLTSVFKENVTINDVPAGLHFTASFKTSKSYDEVEAAAKKHQLDVHTIRRFTFESPKREPNKEIVLVIGFSSINFDDISKAVRRLNKILYE